MKKIVFVFSFLMSLVSTCFAQEQITITTYYPSPVGVYNELRARRMAIGDNWFNPATNVWGTQIDANADLVVEGNVGIGTRTPTGGAGAGITLDISSGTSGDAYLVLEADTDNNNEDDNPIIRFEQDADLVNAVIGLSGSTGNSPFTGTLLNSLVIGSEDGNPNIQFATSDVVRMTITNTGYTGVATNAPNVTFDVRGGDTNLCLKVRYTTTSGNISCPLNYYMMYPPGTSTPAPTNYYICCRGCIDYGGNGVCDFQDANDDGFAD